MMQCPSCRHENLPEARFCAGCGVVLAAADEPPVAPPAAGAPPSPPPVEPLVRAEHVGFGMRFGAWLIDLAAIVAISIALSILSLFGSFLLDFGGFGFPALLIPWLYFWLFTGLTGQTPGKMLIGIKVVDEQGNVPGLGRAALREIVGKPISTIPFFLGFLWIGWDGRKEGWHDKIARTSVVRSRP